MRVLIAGGGTAGHINPAIAIADKIKENEPDSVIEFIGTKRGMENELVKRAGYAINRIEMRGFQRRFTLSNVSTIYYYFTAPTKARRLIRDFHPDAIIGTGGYLSWPLLSAAHSLGIPAFLHESNALPGKTVKMLQNKVNKIYLNYAITASYLDNSAKTLRVGNPLLHFNKSAESGISGLPDGVGKIILSFGGSIGAEKLTEAIAHAGPRLLSERSDIYIIHASGAKKLSEAEAAIESCGLKDNSRFELRSYIYDMPAWLSRADVVICRAGAMTLSELAAYGKAAIVIPSPYVADNHQYINAKTLADKDAAILLEEKNLTADTLYNAITSLLDDSGSRETLCKNIKAFAPGNAAQEIYDDIKSIIS